jgi:hypothetical protein
VAGATQTDQPQLLCFHEKSSGDKTETAKTAYSPTQSAPIIALDALPVRSGGSAAHATHDILATFANGHVVCLSADLGTVRWTARLSSEVGESIEHVSTATAKAVSRGLLRSREDVAAILNPTADDDLQELTQVLCIVGRQSTGATTLSLVQVQPRSADLTTSPLSPLKLLVSWHLPVTNSTKKSSAPASSARYSLHASTGILHILKGTAFFSFDISDDVPKLYSELVVPGADVDSYVRLSQDVLLTTTGQTCRVIDARYNTLQAVHSLDTSPSIPDPASPAKKRKLTQPETIKENSQVHLLAYYSEHDLVVAVRESEVIGMQVESSLTHKRARHEGTLLSDALGKGLSSVNSRETQKWLARRAKLDRYVSKGKISKFESALAGDLDIELEAKEAQTKKENEVNGGPLTNGVGPKISEEDAMAIDLEQQDGAEDESRRWKIPSVVADARRPQYRQYASYALGKIFRAKKVERENGISETTLKIQFYPPSVFQWLLQTGHLSAASVRHALLQESPDNAQAASAIVDGDIVKSLVDFDPDLHIVSAILNYSGHLPVGEVVQAIKLLMQSLDEEPKVRDETKLLTNGDACSEEDMDVDFASELDAATNEVDHALSVLDHGLLIRSHTLRPALIRLHSFAPRLITSTLRTMLPRRDLESLISLLHLEMRNGGWSSSYDSSELELSTMEPLSESPDDHAVAIIASLLSCTLDAIGAGAWLATVRSADSASSEDIIDSLQNDTSEALKGFWEARFMRGPLGEFLRFASSAQRSNKQSSKSLERQGKPFTFTRTDDELPMLPLGAKPDLGIERMKAGKGGKKQERSAREMGMLISKKVPKYSFERIVL